MPTINIDGKNCAFEGKKMILQVALENGIELPHYCYHPGLSIVASCRICLAELEQKDPKTGALVMQPKLFPTCQTPAADGMVVHTQSPKSIANQKAVMEYLLINHPLDCPVCDQAGECHLQDYSYQYGRAQSRFEEDKIKQPKKDIGLHVLLYSDRCIMCSRCVRFTKEVSGTGELGIFGRGAREQIDVFPGKPLNNPLSGNVVDICPVGALLDKDFLFTQRVWFLTSTPSIDGITASGDNLRIDHNEGRIYRIKPRANAVLNKWWISDEIRYGWKFVHREDRLTQPQRLQYGSSVTCDWNTALKDAADGLKAAVNGGKRTALMVSPMLSCEEAHALCQTVRTLDPQAVIGIGAVPRQGEDQTFPGGYTIYAEKAPNARGVRRVIESFVGAEHVLEFDKLLATIKDAASNIDAVVVTGNYPSAWVTKELTAALAKKFVIWLDTLPNEFLSKANVVLPSATWVEKSGCFENIKGIIQSFQQAIPVIEFARTEGQIALDLRAAAGAAAPEVFDVGKLRQTMGGVFLSDVKHPSHEDVPQPDMEFVAL